MEKATLGQGQELFKLVLQSGIEKDAFQALLESGKFTALLNEFMMGQPITRLVRVDRTRTPKKAIKVTNRVEYTDDSAVESMPAQGKGVEQDVEVVFFNLGRLVNDNNLAAEYEKRGLKPDPYAVSAVNEADPSFADEHPNATHWKDADGNWCLVAFDRSGSGRDVNVRRSGNDWLGSWWFGGVRK
ncbi:MAG TPA: hypothetical protein ENN28_03935 [Candidatus Uhrbacteria bacterium]|nr:hypothetical protein [Candidatus Uhrbacteria bacterium]